MRSISSEAKNSGFEERICPKATFGALRQRPTLCHSTKTAAAKHVFCSGGFCLCKGLVPRLFLYSGIRQQAFYQRAFFVEHAAAFVIFHQNVPIPQGGEEGRVQRVVQGCVSDVDVGIGRERAGLGAAVGVDVEESSARGHAAAGALFVAREGDVDHLRVFAAQTGELPAQERPLLLSRREVLAVVGHRDVFHKDDRLAPPIGEGFQKRVGAHLADVLRRDRHGGPEDQAAPFQLVHAADQALVDALAAPRIGHGLRPLDAQDRDKVAAAVKERVVRLVHEGAVGEDREQNALPLSGSLDDVPPQHRLTACQQDEADAQVVGLLEDLQPFSGAELAFRLCVGGRVIAAGITSGAVEITLAGDAGDQERGDMLPGFLRCLPFFGGRGRRRRKFQHEGAFPGIFQRGLHQIPHKVLDALRQVCLEIKRFVHVTPRPPR